MQALIFTDLDSTLMEHDSYSIGPAREVLAQLATRGASPIFNSSKTRAEICEIQSQLSLHCAFICENGAALHNYLEAGELDGEESRRSQVFGTELDSWLDAVHSIRDQHGFNFAGFSDWSADEVAHLTGLDSASAGLAKLREYSEPIQWYDSDSALSLFGQALSDLDLQLVEGGRFFSIQGNYDKSTPMRWLMGRGVNHGKPVIALGDSPNDTAMLDAADIAVIVKSAKSDRVELNNPARTIRTSAPGPEGWQAAMTEIIELLESGSPIPKQENNHG